MNILTDSKTLAIVFSIAAGIPLLIALVVIMSMCPANTNDTTYPPKPETQNQDYNKETLSPTFPQNDTVGDEINSLLKSWAIAWEIQSIHRFMSHYSKSFNSRNMNHTKLRKYQQNIFDEFKTIDISIFEIKCTRISDKKVEVHFVQILEMDKGYDKGRVTMTLIKEGNDWKIISETWRKYY